MLLVERDGQFKSDTQSLEDLVHFKVSEFQWLPTIHLAAQFWTASSKAQSLAVWVFHTTQVYSIHGQTMLLYATSRLESIMLQNLLIMLFGISPIFCLLCSFLCFLGMHYADNLYL